MATAAQFFIPYSIAAKPTNVGAPGALGYFFEPSSTTLKNIWAEGTLTTPLPNPVVADGAGRWPNIYLDASETYRFYVTDKNGAELYDQDPYTPGTLYIPAANIAFGIVSVKDPAYGAAGDGVTDDTAAITAALAANGRIHFPAGRYLVSSFNVPGNTVITTEGFDTIFVQKAGSVAGTRAIKVTGSNVNIGDFAYEGQLNQAGDTTDQQNHGLFIAIEDTSTASISNVTIGNVKGTNVRGDVVFIGTSRALIGTATMTIASPGVVTRAAHGLAANTRVSFATTGALPTGLLANNGYYVRNPTANTFELAAAPNGVSINTSGAQSGVHTLYANLYSLSNISVGKVSGDNIYRSVASVTGGSDISIESITGTQVGLYAFDAEPDPGNGPITGLRIDYIKGRTCAFVGDNATDYVDAWVGEIDLDPLYTTASTPPLAGTYYEKGLYYRNCTSLRVDRFYANGHASQAISAVGGNLVPLQSVSFGTVEIPTGCLIDRAVDYYIFTESASQVVIENLVATTTIATHNVLGQCYNLTVGTAYIKLLTGSYYMRGCVDCTTDVLNLSTNGAGAGGAIALNSTRCKVNGGTQVANNFFEFGNVRCTATGVNATMANAYDSTGTNNLFVNSYLGGGHYYLLSPAFRIADDGAFLAAGTISGSNLNTSGLPTSIAALSVVGNGTNAAAAGTALAAASDGQVVRRAGTAVAFGALDLASANAVTGDLAFANITQLTGLSVAGRSANTLGDIAAITGTDGQVLRVSGTALGFGTIVTAGIADTAVTYAKIQNVSATARLLGRTTVGAGVIEEISLAGGLAFSGSTLTAAGALTPTSVASTGAVTTSGATAGLGYATGAGGAVSQATNRTTGVTLNKAAGAITLFSTTTTAGQVTTFTVTNSAVAATDTINVCMKSGTGIYLPFVTAVSAGSFAISVYSPAAVGVAEAPVINFALIKAVAA